MIPYVNIHTHHPVGTGIELSSNGVHPWDAASTPESALEKLAASHPAYIGEIGLDYSRDIDREAQKKWLTMQAELAGKLGVPIIIHCVRAYEDLVHILSGYNVPKIVHGFTGHPQFALSLTDKGYYLSFAPGFMRSPKTIEAIKAIPNSLLLLETDDRDTPIEEVYSAAAEALGIGIETLKERIYDNYLAIFPNAPKR